MDIKEMIGARIKEIRMKKGLTQESVAERMDISSNYLSSIERGRENPTLNTLIKLSESLEVNLGEMLSFAELQDPAGRKSRLKSILNKADNEQLKVIIKIVSAILH